MAYIGEYLSRKRPATRPYDEEASTQDFYGYPQGYKSEPVMIGHRGVCLRATSG